MNKEDSIESGRPRKLLLISIFHRKISEDPSIVDTNGDDSDQTALTCRLI